MPTSLTTGLGAAGASGGPATRAPHAPAPPPGRAPGSDRPPPRAQRFLGNAPIRVKVVLITLVPLIAMFLFAGILFYIVTGQAQSAQQVQQLARLGNESSSLVQQLQVERSAAASFYLDPGQGPTAPTLVAYRKQINVTDLAVRSFLDQSARLDKATRAPIANDLDAASAQAGGLTTFRSNVIKQSRQTNTLGVPGVTREYQTMIDRLQAINDQLAASTDDRVLASQIRAAAAFGRQKELASQEQIDVLAVINPIGRAQPNFTKTQYTKFLGNLADQAAAAKTFDNSATEKQRDLLRATLTTTTTIQATTLEDKLERSGPGVNPGISPAVWQRDTGNRLTIMRTVESQFNDDIVRDAGSFRDDAVRKTIIVITIALAALVIALLVSLAVARSMVRPLVRLRSAALEVAYQSLPDVVRKLQDADQNTAATAAAAETRARSLDIRSGDEIGQVAQAFNAVHLEAVRVASEQAQLRRSVSTMFVNLSRRSQLLVDRLIRLIDGLEQGERDPDRLGELFKLDHLATRMRRNDENLLVLAGADAGRRWTRPAPLVDVLRAATAEVEQYTRVKLGSVDDGVEISAAAVNDLVHLVAELLENATSFSSPRTDVVVDSRRVGDNVVIEIEDQGIGMSRDQLAEFNERLAKPPVFDIAVSRMMGLFVVGRLASRHGVKVMLRDASGGGVLAIVTLPAVVLHELRRTPPALPAAPDRGAERGAEQGPEQGRGEQGRGEQGVERVPSERIDRPVDADVARSLPNGYAGAAGNQIPAQPSPAGNFNGHGDGPMPVRTPGAYAPAGAQSDQNPDSNYSDQNYESGVDDISQTAPTEPIGRLAAPSGLPTRTPFAPRDEQSSIPSASPSGPPPPPQQPAFGPTGTGLPLRHVTSRGPNAGIPQSPAEWPGAPGAPGGSSASNPPPEQPAAPEGAWPVPGQPETGRPAAEEQAVPAAHAEFAPPPSRASRPEDQFRPDDSFDPFRRGDAFRPDSQDGPPAPTRATPRPSGGLADLFRPRGPQAPPAASGPTRQVSPSEPLYAEPTREVPTVRDPLAADASGVHRLLDGLRPEQPPEPAREPDLTWSDRRDAEDAEGPVAEAAQAPTGGDRPEDAAEPAAAAEPAPARPGPAPRPGSAADAMAVLRSEAAADRTGNTGAQPMFRAGPSDPPNSDPTIEMPLPIFDSIESEWFRVRVAPRGENGHSGWQPPRVPDAPGLRKDAGRPSPADPESAPGDRPERMGEEAGFAEAPVSPAVSRPDRGAPAPGRPDGPRTPPEPALVGAGNDRADQREPVSVGAARQGGDEGVQWESPADRGWRAAQAAAEPTVAGTTKSGLPKRVPMAHFVPGRVEAASAPRAERSAPARSPEAVRGVLSSYRSGLEQGRQAGRPRSGTTFAGSREEQEEM